jgi:hypothetical protein
MYIIELSKGYHTELSCGEEGGRLRLIHRLRSQMVILSPGSNDPTHASFSKDFRIQPAAPQGQVARRNVISLGVVL